MTQAEKQRLFLIDGNAFCYRAFYAIRSLSDSKGRPTNALYGFVSMLQKIIADYHPELLAVAFDMKGPTFRHKRFEKYKIQRKPMPDSLVEQMPVIKEIVRAYNIALFEKEGFEADDIIATIADRAYRKGLQTYILTGDKDALQLVNDRVSVLNIHKDGLLYDRAKVKELFQVFPEHIVDLIGLMGDQSDNIPGVTGIGEKTAVELMRRYETLEDLLDHAEEMPSVSKRKLLAKYREDALLSKELAILDRDVPITIDFEMLRFREPKRKELLALFKEFELKRFLNQLSPDTAIRTECVIVDTEERFAAFFEKLKKLSAFALDFETTGTDPVIARPVGVSFCWEEGTAYYLPLQAYPGQTDLPDGKELLSRLKGILEDEGVQKIGQNIKYETVLLAEAGIALGGIWFDTMVASYLLNPSRITHSLDDLSLEYLDHKMTPITELIGSGKNQGTMDTVELGKIALYCAQDSDVTYRLKTILERRLAEEGLTDLFTAVEMPLVKVLADMEKTGVKLDTGLLDRMSGQMRQSLESIQEEVWKLAGEEFNLNSPKQLSNILFGTLHLPVIKKTKTGFSTDEEVLRKLAEVHPLPKKLLEYRELSKLASTYVDALPKMVSPTTGRLHTSFNQTVTATGRLSSSQPNLQNIPVRTEMGRKIRQAFIATPPENLLLSADYSQIELRILAHLSKDARLVKAFAADEDIHVHTASLIFEVPEDEVTPQMRAVAKTVNFGIIYGMSAYGLSKDLGIEILKAQRFIDNYFERYPGVKEYLDGQILRARTEGAVVTLLGRRRFIPEVKSSDIRIRQFGERMAINTPVQGSAADIMKEAMIRLHNELKGRRLRARLLLQVHDELLLEVDRSDIDRTAELVREAMEHVRELLVPIRVKMKTGTDWLTMEERK